MQHRRRVTRRCPAVRVGHGRLGRVQNVGPYHDFGRRDAATTTESLWALETDRMTVAERYADCLKNWEAYKAVDEEGGRDADADAVAVGHAALREFQEEMRTQQHSSSQQQPEAQQQAPPQQ